MGYLSRLETGSLGNFGLSPILGQHYVSLSHGTGGRFKKRNIYLLVEIVYVALNQIAERNSQPIQWLFVFRASHLVSVCGRADKLQREY